MRGDPDGPPAVWDIGHVGYREGTSQEICCSGFETQGGYSKLLDAHPEFNLEPWPRQLDRKLDSYLTGYSTATRQDSSTG